MSDVIQIPLPILARALARYHESGATSTMKSTSAAILVDMFEMLRAEGGAPDSLEFWAVIEAARKAERERVDAWLAEARARRAEQAIGASEAPGEGS